jgi:V/A-type H+-transporting ATPase subunit K
MNLRYNLILIIFSTLILTPAFAVEQGAGELVSMSKFFAASVAFAAAAVAAGMAVARAGAAGLAATAERPEMRTTAIIITALGEAIAIYGIVVAILILGS